MVVGEGVPLFDLAEAGCPSGGEEHCLGERGLPRPSVADEGHVADVVRRVFLHIRVESSSWFTRAIDGSG